MKWIGRRQSSNVDDRRRMPAGGKLIAGGGLIGLAFYLLQLFLGGGNGDFLNQIQQDNLQQSTTTLETAAEDSLAGFSKVVLADCEEIWMRLFEEAGLEYALPTMVLFSEATTSGCGHATASVGPFYCPADEKLYMDLSFFNELKNKFGAQGGDFAIAYVIAHEVGHHVQHLLGTSDKVHGSQQNMSEADANKLSVALELQADFYAGIWAHYNQKFNNVLEHGDIEEALSAASAVGDDHLQKIGQGYVVPDAFTHGTSKQRMHWFMLGYRTGDLKQGNTFGSI